MAIKLKLRKIGNSMGVILPKEVLAQLKVQEGDILTVTEMPEESLRLQRDDEGFAEKMAAVDDICQRYHHTLRELAK